MHSIAYYSGSDVGKYMPSSYPSTISICNLATSENGTPKMRVAKGSYPRWASAEARQCQYDGTYRPSSSDQLHELNVRVAACVTGKDDSSGRCKQYPSGYSKPTGLLQKFGEDGRIRFGLISGSYDKNISGGVLRKNIGRIASNQDPSNDEINLDDGTFNNLNGIINHINTFRIAKYNYQTNRYKDCNTYDISVGSFKTSRGTDSSRHCSMWGNPLSEMYLEALRYFAGKTSPTSTFNTNRDDSYITGLESANWSKVQNSNNSCANCSIIVLSSALNSFDADELGSSRDIPGLSGVSSVHQKTNQVADIEFDGNFSGQYLFGGSGSSRQCTDKFSNDLSSIRGICPEQPQLEGSYAIAGLAFHARNTDLRPDLEGIQNVKTYTIQLADNVPSFTLNAAGNELIFQPVCHVSSNVGSGPSNFSGSGSDCTLVDIVIEDLQVDTSGHPIEGNLLFVWEASLWGYDFDFDASSRIKFCVGNRCNTTSDEDLEASGIGVDQVRIAVRFVDVAAGRNMRFSYTVTGSSSDGLQTNYIYKGESGAEVRTYTATGATAGTLPQTVIAGGQVWRFYRY